MVKDAEFIRKKTRAIDIMASKGMWSSNYAPLCTAFYGNWE